MIVLRSCFHLFCMYKPILFPSQWKKYCRFFCMWWHVSFGTSCYMLHLFQIHCPSQKDLTVPRPAHHQVHHPCRRFANSYDSPFRRFTRRLASGTHQLQMIKSATSTGLNAQAFTERNDTKPL